MLLALYPHPSSNRRMIGSDHIRTEPETTVEEYTDIFGNRCARLEVPPSDACSGGLSEVSKCRVNTTLEMLAAAKYRASGFVR